MKDNDEFFVNCFMDSFNNFNWKMNVVLIIVVLFVVMYVGVFIDELVN